MGETKNLFQSADWKTEKHVPVIDCPDSINKGESVLVEITVGKEMPHPNTTAHHIEWIQLFFHPDGEKFPYEVGKAEFKAHGASIDGADASTVYTDPITVFRFKTGKTGKLIAVSYCNIHGLWTNEKFLKVL
ncbi:MAG: Neelaredoxin [Candidatus Marinimicrobia bacterium]|nr:Neelaredoxin [Candidatus Neomarinimicrobiota bacterium]